MDIFIFGPVHKWLNNSPVYFPFCLPLRLILRNYLARFMYTILRANHFNEFAPRNETSQNYENTSTPTFVLC